MVRYICCMLFAIAMLHLANGEDEMSLFVSVVEPSSGDDGNAKASNENPTFKPQEGKLTHICHTYQHILSITVAIFISILICFENRFKTCARITSAMLANIARCATTRLRANALKRVLSPTTKDNR